MSVSVVDGVIDEGMECFEIRTLLATYCFQKEAGGLSSLVDPEGNDWISFCHKPGSAGLYRGIPNLVDPDDFFHPGHPHCRTELVEVSPHCVTLQTEERAGRWACLWSFYSTHVAISVLKHDKPFWFLYEGTPCGRLDTGTQYCRRSRKSGWETRGAAESWAEVLEDPDGSGKYVMFGDRESDYEIFFHCADNRHVVDSYWPMEESMTVFGFGRDGLESYLTDTPSRFSMGLVDVARGRPPAALVKALIGTLRDQREER